MTSAGSAFAVGVDVDASGVHPLSEHWNGSRWSLVRVSSPAQALLLSVARIPTTAHYWAVGTNLATGQTTLIERHC